MTARQKREPRQITVAEIEQRFQLAGYWWGTRWCPAVWETSTGYAIRVLMSETVTGASRTTNYGTFELDPDGTITTAPRGYAKEFRPGRVTDIEAAVKRYATPSEPTS